MIAGLLLLATLTQAPAESPATVTHETPAPAETPAHGAGAAEDGGDVGGHEATGAHGEEAHGPSAVLMHHVLDQPWIFGIPSKHLAFFVLAGLLVLFWIRLALRNYRNRLPGKLASAVEALVLFIRDDIAEKNIGHDGHKYTPLLCSFFFFILVAALLGLTPFSATSTGNLAVTAALATISFLAQQYAGISKYGVVKHFAHLVPPGLPVFLLPIMIPVEILSMFTKPFALMIRLFANMLAGHMVITTLLLLIPLMAQIGTFFGVSMIPVSLGLSLFIMLLELLVAFIQAYIFTLLTAIFIGMYAHPAH
ncbi:MAG: F0F1 ATP synthase subunit A [Acidobacteria bacterium]|nr:F0F1 ATP synthase subunit A [Acidobacteriota bacterium]